MFFFSYKFPTGQKKKDGKKTKQILWIKGDESYLKSLENSMPSIQKKKKAELRDYKLLFPIKKTPGIKAILLAP